MKHEKKQKQKYREKQNSFSFSGEEKSSTENKENSTPNFFFWIHQYALLISPTILLVYLLEKIGIEIKKEREDEQCKTSNRCLRMFDAIDKHFA